MYVCVQCTWPITCWKAQRQINYSWGMATPAKSNTPEHEHTLIHSLNLSHTHTSKTHLSQCLQAKKHRPQSCQNLHALSKSQKDSCSRNWWKLLTLTFKQWKCDSTISMKYFKITNEKFWTVWNKNNSSKVIMARGLPTDRNTTQTILASIPVWMQCMCVQCTWPITCWKAQSQRSYNWKIATPAKSNTPGQSYFSHVDTCDFWCWCSGWLQDRGWNCSHPW